MTTFIWYTNSFCSLFRSMMDYKPDAQKASNLHDIHNICEGMNVDTLKLIIKQV